MFDYTTTQEAEPGSLLYVRNNGLSKLCLRTIFELVPAKVEIDQSCYFHIVKSESNNDDFHLPATLLTDVRVVPQEEYVINRDVILSDIATLVYLYKKFYLKSRNLGNIYLVSIENGEIITPPKLERHIPKSFGFSRWSIFAESAGRKYDFHFDQQPTNKGYIQPGPVPTTIPK